MESKIDMPSTKKYADIKKRYLDRSPAAAQLWAQSKKRRALGVMLASIRASRKMSQFELAERAGWDKSYVSRLEGVQGPFPELKTLMRYVSACNASLYFKILDESGPDSKSLGEFVLQYDEDGNPVIVEGRASEIDGAKTKEKASDYDHVLKSKF